MRRSFNEKHPVDLSTRPLFGLPWEVQRIKAAVPSNAGETTSRLHGIGLLHDSRSAPNFNDQETISHDHVVPTFHDEVQM